MGYVILVVLWAHLMPFNFLKKNIKYPIAGKGFTKSRLMDARGMEDVEILFLGSSHTFRGFDPRIFKKEGTSSFNLGSPSQTPFQTRLLLEAYVDQFNPRLVIYEVYPSTFQNDGVESSLDLMANRESISNSFTIARKINHIKTWNTLIYDTFRESLDLNSGEKEPITKGTDRYVAGGFVESLIKSNIAPVTEIMRDNWGSDTWEIRDWQWVEFQKTLSMLRERKIEVVFLQMPVTKPAFLFYKNNDFIDSLFASQGSYENLNYVLDLDDDRDFIDYHHLSQTGVEKVNTELIKWLKAKGYLKNSTVYE